MICNCLDGNASKIEPIKKATQKVWKYSPVILFVGFKFYGKKTQWWETKIVSQNLAKFHRWNLCISMSSTLWPSHCVVYRQDQWGKHIWIPHRTISMQNNYIFGWWNTPLCFWIRSIILLETTECVCVYALLCRICFCPCYQFPLEIVLFWRHRPNYIYGSLLCVSCKGQRLAHYLTNFKDKKKCVLESDISVFVWLNTWTTDQE